MAMITIARCTFCLLMLWVLAIEAGCSGRSPIPSGSYGRKETGEVYPNCRLSFQGRSAVLTGDALAEAYQVFSDIKSVAKAESTQGAYDSLPECRFLFSTEVVGRREDPILRESLGVFLAESPPRLRVILNGKTTLSVDDSFRRRIESLLKKIDSELRP